MNLNKEKQSLLLLHDKIEFFFLIIYRNVLRTLHKTSNMAILIWKAKFALGSRTAGVFCSQLFEILKIK